KENLPMDGSTALRASRKQKNMQPRAQDVEFVSDVGHGLLLECRKLQVALTDKEEKIKELENQRLQMASTIESLEFKIRELDESEERYKEENWNFELKIQELQTESANVAQRLSMINIENAKTLQMYNAQLENFEAVQQREVELTHQLESFKDKYERDLQSHEQMIADLQNENSKMQQTIESLNNELAQASMNGGYGADESYMDEPMSPEVSDGLDDPKTPERSPPLSPVKATPAHHASLEGETLKASLSHAHRAISTLRGTVHREKTEKIELRRLLTEAQEELEVLKNNKGSGSGSNRRKNGTNNQAKRNSLLGLTGRRSQIRISADLDEADDIEWETFNGADNSDAERFVSTAEFSVSETDGFETAKDAPTSDEEVTNVALAGSYTETEEYLTGLESVGSRHNLEEDDYTETEQDSPSKSRIRTIEDMTDDDEDIMGANVLRSRLSVRNLKTKVKRNSGSFAPTALFDELGSSPFASDKTPTKFIPSERVSMEPLTAVASNNVVEVIKTVEVPVEVIKEVIKEVEVIKEIEVIKEVQVPTEVVKEIEVPVEVIREIEVPIEVIKEVEVPVEVIKEVPVEIIKEVPTEVVKEVEVPKEVVRTVHITREPPPPTVESVIADAKRFSMVALSRNDYDTLMSNLHDYESRMIDTSSGTQADTYEGLHSSHDPDEITFGSPNTSIEQPKSINVQGTVSPAVIRENNQYYHGSMVAPQLIHAITQTMIGEEIWKYTRKRGRQTMSQNRHRRYFWIHPYTRTIYWSDRNPSLGNEARVKSAQIEDVKVVGDNNPYPPGLCHSSIVVSTATRTLKITCPTQERHDIWYNALSFLLLR
ncbi:meiotic cell cortex C-terminal pleckstrin homology-domain-containing protein, partial [Dipodascopsis uninucleata]